MLTIERIETIPLRMRLPITYSWNHYRMRDECTVVTPLYTSAGIVGFGGHYIPDSREAKEQATELSR